MGMMAESRWHQSVRAGSTNSATIGAQVFKLVLFALEDIAMLMSDRLRVWKTAYNTANLPVGMTSPPDAVSKWIESHP